MENKLKQFEEFMQGQYGWSLVNKNESMVSYQKVTHEKKPSCLIAFLLFFFFIIPAIIYLFVGGKPGKVSNVSVSVLDDGNLSPSGDNEGMKVYNQFLMTNTIQV